MKDFIEKLLRDKNLYEHFKNNFTYHSSAIEGSTISEEDNAKILQNQDASHPDLMKQTKNKYDDDELQENFNLGKLFDYMIFTINEPINEREIKIWHNILKKDTIWSRRNTTSYGKYKSIPNTVNSYETPQPHEIEELMFNFINDINKMTNCTLEAVCNIHCRFELIHPFLDGNGRIGRMLMLRMCLSNNIYPFIINNDTKSEYYTCLQMYRQTKSSNFLAEYCKKLQVIFIQKFSAFLNDIHITEVINWFKKHKTLKRLDVEKIFNVKKSNAKKILLKLLNLNLIQIHGKGSMTFYTLK